jgi:hypothetical protein
MTKLERPSARAALVVSLVLAAGVASSTAVVVPAFAAGSDESLAAGLKRFDDGRKAYEAGQFEEALIAFKTSLELLPSPNTRLYVGRCYRALGKTAAAHTALKLAAREAQDRQNASGEKRYAATRDTATQEAAELEARVPSLTVVVPASPPLGFVVKMDGIDLPRAAWGVATETDPGEVVIEAAGPRLVPFKQTVSLKEGAHERLEVAMTRVPTAVFSVQLKSLPAGLTIALDGQPVDVLAAQTPREVDVGPHRLEASAPGYLPFKWSRSLADAETQVVEVALAPGMAAGGAAGPGGTPRWLFFTAAGMAIVSAGVATGIALHAQDQQNQQLSLDPFARDPNVKSSVQTQAVWTDVLFTASGLFGAGAVALAFTTRWKDEEKPAPTASVMPSIGPGAGGIVLHGTF